VSVITELSLTCTPLPVLARDAMSVVDRRARAEALCTKMLDFAEQWSEGRGDGENYWDFEEAMREVAAELGRAATELMFSSANERSSAELPARCTVGGREFRRCPDEPRSFNSKSSPWPPTRFPRRVRSFLLSRR
jgi:hypothetical protein